MKSILSIVLILLTVSSCKFIEKRGWFGRSKADDTMDVWQARQDSIRVADSINLEIQKMQAIEHARIDSLRMQEEARLASESMFRFHIIVGSFLTPEYADDHKDLYTSLGYSPSIIDGPRGRFRLVSAEVHDNINTALSRLSNFQDTVEFEAWLYIRE